MRMEKEITDACKNLAGAREIQARSNGLMLLPAAPRPLPLTKQPDFRERARG